MRRQLRIAMGGLGDVEDPPPQTRPVWFVRHRTEPKIDRPAELVLEGGTTVTAAAAGQALNDTRVIDRNRVHALKLAALERMWTGFGGDPRFDAFAAEQGTALWQYAVYCALAERHGSGWSEWPSEHRRFDSPG